jgi:hypothetical protein
MKSKRRAIRSNDAILALARQFFVHPGVSVRTKVNHASNRRITTP